jgi:perosamine synthetase
MTNLDLIDFIREHYKRPTGSIPLHAPTFTMRDKDLVVDAIDSTFVSGIGGYVNRFESELARYTHSKHAIATVNGTCALQVALQLVGVEHESEVITQPLTFVATANAITYLGALPVFLDVDRDSMGLSPEALESWLNAHGEKKSLETATGEDAMAVNKETGRRIGAIVPMHTFGRPCRIAEIVEIARKWSIPVVEDAAESLGSWVDNTHCGVFGDIGVLSFNGNKIITGGGGGALITDDTRLAEMAKHLTTTAKVPHQWEYDHDQVGYNFRMPNLNAALACAQLERLEEILAEKRTLARAYESYFENQGWAEFCCEPPGTTSNYWLCALVLESAEARDAMLHTFNSAGIQMRPIWKLMTELPMYKHCQQGALKNACWLRQRVVNLPSGVRENE